MVRAPYSACVQFKATSCTHLPKPLLTVFFSAGYVPIKVVKALKLESIAVRSGGEKCINFGFVQGASWAVNFNASGNKTVIPTIHIFGDDSDQRAARLNNASGASLTDAQVSIIGNSVDSAAALVKHLLET
jgi:hypothetical protein